MPAYYGEIFTLRPEGFQLDARAIETFIQRVPGAYRRNEPGQWNVVVPATDLQSWRDEPTQGTPAILGPQYVTIHINDERIWVHPGHTADTWGCAQRIITWLLGLGPWRVQGLIEEYFHDHGVVRVERDLFSERHYNPDVPFQVPDDLTTSPPLVGELTILSRRTGDKDKGDYSHISVRVHDAGAFSCDYESDTNHVRWDGRLTAGFIGQWKLFVAVLNFDEDSTTVRDNGSDPVGIQVERADGQWLFQSVDARNPQPSFATLVRLMDGWFDDLLHDKEPAELTDLQMTFPRDAQ